MAWNGKSWPSKGPVLWFGQKSKNWIKLNIFHKHVVVQLYVCVILAKFPGTYLLRLWPFLFSQCTKLLFACNRVPKYQPKCNKTTDCLKCFQLGWVLGLLPLSEFCPCNKASLWLYLKFALHSPIYPCFYL